MRDAVVIGAGIVGLATAWRLATGRPDLDVVVLEKEAAVGAHQSSHNSGVLHAGVYYPPGSRKARLCRRGKRQLQELCDRLGVDYALTGKVIVAVDRSELGRLDELERRARTNGVPGLRRLSAGELREVEPHTAGVAALHSPVTGVIDFGAVCRALHRELEELGVSVRLGTEVIDLEERAGAVGVTTSAGPVTGRVVIACAGLHSDRVAAMTGDAGDQRIVPFRGSWVQVRPHAAHLVRGNVYPVPDPGLPFLGVHLTRRLDGSLMIGPNAVLAADREGYGGLGAFAAADVVATAGWPGFWRLVREHWATGARELVEDLLVGLYLRRVRRYVPSLTRADVTAGPCGIRAQAVDRAGRLVDDFSLGGTRRIVHVRNAPSPAATASLAIGEVLRDEVLERLEPAGRA